MALSKRNFISALSEETGYQVGALKEIMDGLSRLVMKQLAEEDKVTIPGVVMMRKKWVAYKPAQKTRNPRTGELVDSPAKPAHWKIICRTPKVLSEFARELKGS